MKLGPGDRSFVSSVAKRSSVLDSSSGVSEWQGLGLSPDRSLYLLHCPWDGTLMAVDTIGNYSK